jgi:hypothetical protein
MRRSYISPEYQNKAVSGTLNMLEESTFFGAKMLEVDDSIKIENQDIIYYQNIDGEQLDFAIESSFVSYVYSSYDDKEKNHKLIKDPTQPKYQLDINTRWSLRIELKDILSNYLFATMKKYRTFEGVANDSTKFNDVNVAIHNYIRYNILNRYKYIGIELYVNYKDLRDQDILRYKNKWSDEIIINDSTKLTKLQTNLEFDDSSITILFNQEKPSSEYKFDYYFNITFEKI